MAKSQKLEAALSQLKAIQPLESFSEGDVQVIQKIVQGKQSMAIAPATQLIVKHQLVQLIPDLITAFERMLQNGEKTDPSCKAKWAIANSLYQLERPDVEMSLAGIRHIQKEPVWGGTQDTAAPLRSLCALALAQANYPELLNELADLLTDDEHDARAGAARAIGYSRNPAGIPLLRLKVHIGDEEPMVLSECFIALLQLSPAQAPMVIGALKSGGEQVQELAAIALGEAKIPEALSAIQQQWKHSRNPDLRQSFLLAIATLRTEEAIDFLITLLERGNSQDAKDAAIALHIYQHTPPIWQRASKAASLRGEADIIALLY
jgi:hypothetical protein